MADSVWDGAEGITTLRAEFDAIDGALLRLLAERRAVSQRMAHLKRAEGLPFRDAAREAAMLVRLRGEAEQLGLSGELVEAVFRLLLADSLSVQQATPPSAT